MTGAPSLTCPECGTDARSPHRLHKRRRSPRRVAVLAILLMTACWYATHVRHRIVDLKESRWEALVPTTALILMEYKVESGSVRRADVLSSRWLGDDGMRPFVPTWQVWLRAWLAYRHAMTAPADTMQGHPADAYLGNLTSLAPYNSLATRLQAKVILEHPARGMRIGATWNCGEPNRLACRPVFREVIWQAIEQQRLDFADIEETLGYAGLDQFSAMSDQQFCREFAVASRPPPSYASDGLTELYLLELLRRRPANTLQLLDGFELGSSPKRALMIATAKERLAGRPDPLKLALSTNESELVVTLTNQRPKGQPFFFQPAYDSEYWSLQLEAIPQLAHPGLFDSVVLTSTGGLFGKQPDPILPRFLDGGESATIFSLPLNRVEQPYGRKVQKCTIVATLNGRRTTGIEDRLLPVARFEYERRTLVTQPATQPQAARHAPLPW